LGGLSKYVIENLIIEIFLIVKTIHKDSIVFGKLNSITGKNSHFKDSTLNQVTLRKVDII